MSVQRQRVARFEFVYGVMGSGKSMSLIAAKRSFPYAAVFTAHPMLREVRSRSGECIPALGADVLAALARNEEAELTLLVDEAQFLPVATLERLRSILTPHSRVVCYGLLADFRNEIFPASRWLLDNAEGVDRRMFGSVCQCGRLASVNARLVDGRVTIEGPVVATREAGVEYRTMCAACWHRQVQEVLA